MASPALGMIQTVDGGRSWHALPVPSGTYPRIVANGEILALGPQASYRLDRSGWVSLALPAPPSQVVITELSAAGSGHAWTSTSYSSGWLYSTDDGGAHWQAVSDLGHLPDLHLGVSSTNGPEEGTFADATRGWFTSQFPPTEPAVLFATFDSGRTWAPQRLPQATLGAPDWISAPRFFDAQTGVIYGNRHLRRSDGWFWTTSDGGRTWSSPIDLPTAPTSASFPDRAHWFVASGTQLWATGDGGTSWRQLPDVVNNSWQLPIQFVDAIHGFALVELPVKRPSCPPNTECAGPAGAGHRQLLATSDGGRTWRPITKPPPAP